MANEDQNHDFDDQANHDHTIDIADRAELMHRRISEPPRLLSAAAGRPSCSIFRVPQSLAEVNGKVYNPHIISVGPYRRGDPGLRMIEEHKWRYLGSLLARPGAPKLEGLLIAAASLEARARACYSEDIPMSGAEFCEMMVLDACFIVELFRKADGVVRCEPDDPIFNMAWIVPYTYRDLLLLENQIPFLILQEMFDLTSASCITSVSGDTAGTGEVVKQDGVPRPCTSPTSARAGPAILCLLGLRFFNHVMQRPEEAIIRCLGSDPEPRHLLDMVRMSLIPPTLLEPSQRRTTPAHVIHCVSKLRRAGIKLREPSSPADSFLVVRFRRGVIEMPNIAVDDFMASFLQNAVAFEQCHNGKDSSKHFTTYATLLDCLINTYRDVEYLSDKNIIENCYGNDGEVARLINNLGKEVAFDIDICYLADLFDDVHSYYKNSWHVQWASFKYTYFDTPWSFISALAALILLLLTVAQTFYTVYEFYG